MSDLIPFSFEGRSIRVLDRNGEPWWVLGEVCRILEIANPRDVASRLDDDEKDVVAIPDVHGQLQGTTIISEPGLYRLLAISRKPEAKRFDRWVRHEVLPSIRKTGSYGTPNQIDYSDPALFVGMLQHLQKQIEAKDKKIEIDAPKVEFVERHANGEGCYGLQVASQMMGLRPNKLSSLLQEYGYIEKTRGGKLRPLGVFSRHPKLYFYMETTSYIHNGRACSGLDLKITPQGLQVFAAEFGTDHRPTQKELTLF